MTGSDCAGPCLRFVDLALQVGEHGRLPVRSFTAKRQRFGFRINSDKRQNISVVFETRLEATPRNRSGLFNGGNHSGQHALSRLNDYPARNNNVGLVQTHNNLV